MRSKDHPEKHPQNEVTALTQALATPFDLASVKFKPAVVNGNRCLALAYVDARVIQDRLDEVLGVEGWQDDYEILSDGSVVCRLRLRLGEDWVTKVDVGSPSEQPDSGDRLKAAFSDALKRAAVKFGVGRYLYRLPSQWVDYDPKRRQMVSLPTLPAFARPQGEPKIRAEAKPKTAAEPKTAARSKTELTAAGHTLPANGAELMRRLQDYDAKLAAQGLCQKG
ncbi:MAG TPA: Rad52/Rad22 family DNA repair protein, partial [Gemmataceae bacterium]|nr:Rad52/Rad22 family DNA repair protein [Gemmataceae bacterium]